MKMSSKSTPGWENSKYKGSKKGQDLQGLVGYCKDSPFLSKYGKPSEGFQQNNNMIRFIFYKNHSSC